MTTAWDFNADMVTGNTDLYAKWNINSYTVAFNVDGGSAVASQTVEYNAKATTPTAPTKTGYTFGGWYKEATLATAWDFSADVVTDDTTLYAKWNINSYAVTFNVDGGSAVASQTIEYRQKVSVPATPTKEGYTFDDWYKDSAFTTAWNFSTDLVTADTTIYAKWNINNYAVTFETGAGASTLTPVTVQYNNKVTKPADPTKTGYTFNGWYKEATLATAWNFAEDTVKANATLYAKWTINTYTVTFELDGGASNDPTSQTVNHGSTATKPADPTKAGYAFDGWFTDAACTNAYVFTTAVTVDITLYAKWTPTYTVTFDTGTGGSAVAFQTVKKNAKAIKPADPTKTDYDFAGWYADSAFTTQYDFDTMTVTADTTIYAKWTQKPLELKLSDIQGDFSVLTEALSSTDNEVINVIDDTNGGNNTLTIGSYITIPAGKTLNLKDGINLDNRDYVIVDGTLNVTGNVTNTSYLIVNSGQSLHVTGKIINSQNATLEAAGNGYIEAASIENSGTITVAGSGSTTSTIKAATITNMDANSGIVIRTGGVLTGTVTNGGWIMDESSGKLKLGSNDAVTDDAYWKYDCDTSDVTSVEIGGGVTEIGDYAFYNCSNLTSVTIPDSVTTIGDDAFYECSSLTAITLPDSVTTIGDYAFSYCSSLATIALPNSVTTIGDGMFSNCRSLATVTLPNSITTVTNSMFSNCSALTSLTIPDSVTMIDSYAFWNCDKLTSFNIAKVTTLGSKVFGGCSSLATLTVSADNTAYSVIDGALYNKAEDTILLCPPGKTSYTFPATVTTIGEGAFTNCTKLTDIAIPGTVTAIQDNAFAECTGLTAVTIPASVTADNFGSDVFEDCGDALTDIWFEDSSYVTTTPSTGAGNKTTIHTKGPTTTFGTNNLTYTQWNDKKGTSISYSLTISGTGAMDDYTKSSPAPWNSIIGNVTAIKIEEGVTTIGNYAFNGCKNLTTVELPKGLESIGSYAFNECYMLETLKFPEGLKSIGKSAFIGCKALKTIEFPEGLESIGEKAFFSRPDSSSSGYNSQLAGEITIPKSVTSIGKSVFGPCTSTSGSALKVVVLSSSTSIAAGMFGGCVNTTTLSVPMGFVFTNDPFASNSNNIVEYRETEGVTEVPADAFYQMHSANYLETYSSNITKVILPDNTTKIGENAFRGMSNMTEINLPDSMTEIGKNAFYYCAKMNSNILRIPENVEVIGDGAFEGCALKEVTFAGNKVTTIGASAFNNNKFTTITIPSSVTSIGSGAFEGRDQYTSSELVSITIPASVTSMGGNVFRYCAKLETVTFEEGCQLTSLPDRTFAACTKLETVLIPKSITSIEDYAFTQSTLKTIIIPDTVTSIKAGAFWYATVDTVVIPAGITAESDSFQNATVNNIYYGGTEEQWNNDNISKASYSKSPNVHYNGCEIDATDLTKMIVWGNTPVLPADVSRVTTIDIWDSVTSIDQATLDACTGLTAITWKGNSYDSIDGFKEAFIAAGNTVN